MFERRPIWALILGLNVCVLIWRISVQEPALLEAETMAGSSSMDYAVGGASTLQQQQQEKPAVSGDIYNKPIVEFVALPKQELYAGKHLLSERRMQANDSSGSGSNSVAIATETVTTTTTILSKKYKYKVAGIDGKSVLPNSSSVNSSRIIISSSSKTRNQTWALDAKLKSNNAKNNNTTTTPPLVMAATLPQRIATATPSPPVTPSPAVTSELSHLIDLHNFAYLMPQPDCHAQIVALILVHSAPYNHDKRHLIRATWGSIATAPPLRLLFLLGAVRDATLQHKLERENALYADMVQGSFVDDYRNMTYKHAMAFKWTLHQCASAQILVKLDDDVYFNTPQLLKYLGDAPPENTTEFPVSSPSPSSVAAHPTARALFRHPHELLFCAELRGSVVKRSYRSKWRVSVREYAHSYYPPYCPGFVVIYSADVVRRLYDAVQQETYFWIDDVHITGVLAQRTNTSITRLLPYVLYNHRLEQLLLGERTLDTVEFLVAWHRTTPEQMRALWQLEEAEANDRNSEAAENDAAFSSSATTSVLASPSSYASYPYVGFR